MEQYDASEISAFRFWSLGRVAANKVRGSNLIEVVPIERTTNLNNEVTDHVTTVTSKIEAYNGSDAKEIDLDTTPSIQAEWHPFGSTNRITSPDVRRGEEVILLKFADSPVIYWIDGRANHVLRRRETVTWVFSNEAEEDKPLTEDNVYMVTVSTHDKHISISTSKSDGEPYAYLLQLNTKEGFFTIKDNEENYVLVDSRNRVVKLHNKDKSFVELNKRVINASAIDEINFTTKKYTLKATEQINEETRTHNYKCANFKGSASGSYVFNAPTFSYKGNVVVDGDHRTTGTSFEANSSGKNNNL